jgi:3-isopropylmalate/(R)-2-methylmalate dehydratase small subunit
MGEGEDAIRQLWVVSQQYPSLQQLRQLLLLVGVCSGARAGCSGQLPGSSQLLRQETLRKTPVSESEGAEDFNTTKVCTVATKLVFEGRCWKFGDHIPTDMITPTHIMFKTAKEMAAFVLETVNPDFPKHVKPGDILVAGRNFGCSSGRALAAKALQATGIGAVVAELFSRTFYRNGHEIGLPLLEAKGIHALVEDGERLRVDIRAGTLENLTSGKTLQSKAPSPFLLEMLASGGLIPLLKSGSFFAGVAR